MGTYSGLAALAGQGGAHHRWFGLDMEAEGHGSWGRVDTGSGRVLGECEQTVGGVGSGLGRSEGVGSVSPESLPGAPCCHSVHW